MGESEKTVASEAITSFEVRTAKNWSRWCAQNVPTTGDVLAALKVLKRDRVKVTEVVRSMTKFEHALKNRLTFLLESQQAQETPSSDADGD